MSRIAFVRQCCVEGQAVRLVSVVDINYIVSQIIHRRRQIISRTAVGFHGGRNAFDLTGKRNGRLLWKSGKVLSHLCLQVCKHCAFTWKGQYRVLILKGQDIRVCLQQGKERGIVLLEISKKKGLQLGNASEGTGASFKKVGIIILSVRKGAKTFGIRTAAGKKGKGIRKPFVGGGHDRC